MTTVVLLTNKCANMWFYSMPNALNEIRIIPNMLGKISIVANVLSTHIPYELEISLRQSLSTFSTISFSLYEGCFKSKVTLSRTIQREAFRSSRRWKNRSIIRCVDWWCDCCSTRSLGKRSSLYYFGFTQRDSSTFLNWL